MGTSTCAIMHVGRLVTLQFLKSEAVTVNFPVLRMLHKNEALIKEGGAGSDIAGSTSFVRGIKQNLTRAQNQYLSLITTILRQRERETEREREKKSYDYTEYQYTVSYNSDTTISERCLMYLHVLCEKKFERTMSKTLIMIQKYLYMYSIQQKGLKLCESVKNKL